MTVNARNERFRNPAKLLRYSQKISQPRNAFTILSKNSNDFDILTRDLTNYERKLARRIRR